MKLFALVLYMCSGVANTCLQPFVFEDKFNSAYDCMIKGYEEGKKKMLDVGRKDVNRHKIYVKFECQEVDIMLPQPKPTTQSKDVT